MLHTIDAAGASGAPPADLPTGVVFWRLFARMGEDVGTSPSPTWQLYVGARSASVDTSWGTKLDINGDGFADVAVGANDAGSAGRAHLYLGGPAGLSTDPDVTLEAPEGTDARFGSSVASAGDVDGDGFGDLLVAANPDNGSLAGQVYLYRGSPTGISGTPNVQFEAPDGVGSDFGSAISSAGDVDADGFADLVVGAVRVAGEGRAYVYRGGPSGPRATPDVTLIAPDGEPDGLFGNAVASAGDTNGDGFAEIIVGAPGGAGLEGRAYLYNGSASGVPETPTTTLDGVDGMFALFGVALACAGDVNGDGFADIVVGANGASSFEGRVHIYSGTPSGVSAAPSDTIVAPDGGEFGIALSGAGDLDGDGFADVVVGAYRVDSAYVYRGALTGLSTTADFALSAPAGMDSNFGRSVGGGGDVDGDGYPDLIVGASGASSWTGETYVYRGGPSGVTTSPAITLVGPDGEGSSFGSSVAATGTVGTPTWNRAAIASSEGANRADGLLCTHSGELTIDHQHSAPLYWEVSAHVGTHYPVLEPPWRVPPAHSDT